MEADPSLRRLWRRRLRESGFVDLEQPDGSLKPPPKPPGRWRSFEKASPLERSATAEYFHRAETFTASSAFARLPTKTRAVWRLHAKGLSNSEVAESLRVTLKVVRSALGAARVAAGLPEVTSTIGHGR